MHSVFVFILKFNILFSQYFTIDRILSFFTELFSSDILSIYIYYIYSIAIDTYNNETHTQARTLNTIW